jgi:hypothetical protein
MNPNIAAQASKGGKKGGPAKQAARLATAQALLADLPPLVTPEDAKLRLALISGMALHSQVSGSAAQAALRAVEVWLKAVALEHDVHRIKGLERRIAELEGELAKARRT